MKNRVQPSSSNLFSYFAKLKCCQIATLTLLLAGLPCIGWADANWVGGTSQDWNNTANWGANPSGQNVFINIATGNYPIVSGTPSWTPVDIDIGQGGGNVGRLDQTGGTLATGSGSWFFVGRDTGTGTYNISGGTLNAGEIHMAASAWTYATTIGTLTLSGSATVNTTGRVIVTDASGWGEHNQGTLTVNGGTLNSEGDMILAIGGASDGYGMLNIAAGGTVNVASTTKRWLQMNEYDSVQAILNVNGGTLNLNAGTDLRFSISGGTGTSAVNLNSGTITSYSGNQTGSGSGVVDLNLAGGSVNDTFNLNGGTLTIGGIVSTLTTGTRVFNFNGGTLKATGDSSTFFGSGVATTANVLAGGAIIDANGHNVAIGQSLVGTGPVTIAGTSGSRVRFSGANTYSGTTTINAGAALEINASSGCSANSDYTVNGVLESFDSLASVTIGALNGSGTIYNTGGTAGTTTFTAGANGHSGTFGGVIANGAWGSRLTALVKTGIGTQTLSGVNSYAGNTTISAGTLALTGSGSLASPNMSVATGAAFDVSALSSYALNGSGTLTIGVDKTSGTTTQGQLVLGSKALTYNGNLTVNKTGSDTLAAGDSFTLVSSSGTFAGWVNSVSLPSLPSGLSWDTNHLATAGVLDVYSFTTTPLTVSMLSNTVATISAGKLANHASSSKATPAAMAASSPAHGLASVSAGALTYTPNADYSGSDTFTVTFADGHGVQTMTVSVTVNAAIAGPTLSGVDNGSGYYKITTSGLPSQAYDVQAFTDGAGEWTKIGTATAGSNGVVIWTDTDPISAHTSRIYRLAQQ